MESLSINVVMVRHVYQQYNCREYQCLALVFHNILAESLAYRDPIELVYAWGLVRKVVRIC